MGIFKAYLGRFDLQLLLLKWQPGLILLRIILFRTQDPLLMLLELSANLVIIVCRGTCCLGDLMPFLLFLIVFGFYLSFLVTLFHDSFFPALSVERKLAEYLFYFLAQSVGVL